MKILKTASGKNTIKISKKEWNNIGKTAGWVKEAGIKDIANQLLNNLSKKYPEVFTKAQQVVQSIQNGNIEEAAQIAEVSPMEINSIFQKVQEAKTVTAQEINKIVIESAGSYKKMLQDQTTTGKLKGLWQDIKMVWDNPGEGFSVILMIVGLILLLS
jgi:hypothetical protein